MKRAFCVACLVACAGAQSSAETPSAQEVGGCVHASSPSAPRDLVQLLERHRFVAHDAPPAHPIVPSGKGDPCDIGTGCAKGLQCAVSPCVVAPCTSGTCQ